jgi:cellulose synthase/poly-beta-1,6-N-acetylglucosamine synthase-like glycosyltransferase
MTMVEVALVFFGAYLTLYVLYQLLLFAANALVSDPPPFEPQCVRRFAVLVPAHNEELYLPRLLASLDAQSYPRDRYRVCVIADNCSDGTVASCRPFNAEVFERVDPVNRGKGYAIGWMLARIDNTTCDAVVIVDGDSIVAADFLAQLNLQIERGDSVIQCYNGVANPGQSWFTRLMDVSRTIANDILHPGKRKLGLSSHLMGNGMCFATQVLRAFGWNAFTVGEDWEYYARLLLSGAHVGYSRHARVYHQESVNLRQASSQRLRWSGGRFQVLRRFAPSLLVAGIRRRSLTCLDASLPLVFPNPSLGMNLTVIGLAVALAHWAVTGSLVLLAWYGVLGFLQFLMFMIGVFHTAEPMASAAAILLAPAFLIWKMGIDVLSMFGMGAKQWKPTRRGA